jgi:hypothetical protein
MAAFVSGSRVSGVVDGDRVALGDLRRPPQKGVGRRNNPAIVGESLDRRQERSYRVLRSPCPNCDVGDLIAGKVERGKGRVIEEQYAQVYRRARRDENRASR